MKLFIISDTHGDHDKVQVPDCDTLIHCGDWSRNKDISCVVDFLRWMERQKPKNKIFIAGNHDLLAEQEPKLFKILLAEFCPSAIYLQDSGVTIDGVKFWGSPVSPRFYNWAFNRDRGEDIKRHWEMIPDDTNVLITHGPPQGILDLSNNWDHATGRKFDDHLGCYDLAQSVIAIRPFIHCFGHIHGSGGLIFESDKTKFINASLMDENYSFNQRGILTEA